MSGQAYQMMCSSEPKIPKTHGSIWISGGICPRTGKPYGVDQHTYIEDHGNHVVVGDEFVCTQCGETIRKIKRNPNITYA